MGLTALGYLYLFMTIVMVAVYVTTDFSGNIENMDPASLDSFNITTAAEGIVVPWVRGTSVRLTSNILWYGNLIVDAEKASSGGKGDSEYVVGYHYFLDVWFGVCCAKAEVLKIYIGGSEVNIEEHSTSATWNDGTGSFYPTEVGDTASPLPGIATMFIKEMYLGMNVNNVPTVHFLVKSVPQNSPLPGDDLVLPNGINPAGFLYELLQYAGTPQSEINLDTFLEAATYWKNVGYGLNIAFTRISKVADAIQKVVGYSGGVMFRHPTLGYTVKADDPNEASIGSFTHQMARDGSRLDADFTTLTIKRKTWEDTKNYFKVTFTDLTQESSTRVIVVKNQASIEMLSKTYQQSLDLTGFTDHAAASRRAFDIMKQVSYPEAQMEGEVWLDIADDINLGDIITVSSDAYGISNFEFRVLTKDVSTKDTNKVKIQGTQVTSRLYTSSYTPPIHSGGFVPQTYEVAPLDYVSLYELPRNPYTGDKFAIAVLATTAQSYAFGYGIYKSLAGADYTSAYDGPNGTFSQFGMFTTAYPSTTYVIDDEVGFTYKPFVERPAYDPIDRADLFNTKRIILAGKEIMGFQTVVLNADGTITLSGIIRGMYNSPIESHAEYAPMWITTLGENVLLPDTKDPAFYKIPAISIGGIEDLATVSPIEVTCTNKASKPWRPGAIYAERTGTAVQVTVYPADYTGNGAGIVASTEALEATELYWEGVIQYNINGGAWVSLSVGDTIPIELSISGSFTFNAKHVIKGYSSDVVSLVIGGTDGEYKV